jgi:hypothetical protein
VEQGRIGLDLQCGASELEWELGRRVIAAGAIRRGRLSPGVGQRGRRCLLRLGLRRSKGASCVVTPAGAVLVAGMSPAESHIRPAELSKAGRGAVAVDHTVSALLLVWEGDRLLADDTGDLTAALGSPGTRRVPTPEGAAVVH